MKLFMQNSRYTPSGQNTAAIVVVIVVILLAGVSYAYFTMPAPGTPAVNTNTSDDGAENDNEIDQGEEMTNETTNIPEANVPPTNTATNTPGGTNVVNTAPQPTTRTFTITGQDFSYSPNEIRVKQGDTVKISFKNAGGFHDFVLDEFGVKTDSIASGATANVEFVADKTGTFEYYCSVGNHRQMGMKGNLIVE